MLAFDEWVELRDAFTQVVISPPLEFRPTIERKKKTIQLEFDEREVLRDSATYVINFGQAIRDLTEGNAAPITFVFSTGSFIDSLSVKGQVIDAYTGNPVEKALLMLYENMADSVVRKERPFYFAITDKEGRFQVNNIKAGAFKAVALLDQNLNYRYDGETEQIGFLDTALVVSDSTQEVKLRLFSESARLFIKEKETNRFGRVKLVFSREPYNVKLHFDAFGQSLWQERVRDTIFLWYDIKTDTTWNLYVERDTITDTLQIKPGRREDFLQTASLTPVATPPTAEKQNPEKPFTIAFNFPLASFDASKILLFEDTTKIRVAPKIELDTAERRRLNVNFQWKPGLSYQAELLPGSVTDIFGLSNVDTVMRTFIAGLPKDFGSLNLMVKNLSPDTNYVIRLLGANEVLVKSFTVENEESFQTRLTMLTPATYTVEIIEDLDGNGRWTTGSYDLHRQPERVMRRTLEQLRANWEVEAEVEAIFEQETAQRIPAGEIRK